MKTRILIALVVVLALAATASLVWAVPVTLYVATTGTDSPTCGTVASPCETIQYAIDNIAASGDTIMVQPGEYAGALVTKGVEIRGTGGATITSGPPHGSGLSQGFRILASGAGATISHLRFTEDVDLTIMGVFVDDVTVAHCTFESPVQGISNWGGSGWDITHNETIDMRTACGGGIAILIADYLGGDASDNVVSHNRITGTLYVAPDDCGGYNGTGIVLFADFRWGGDGAENIAYNRVVKNKISLTSDTPDVVNVVAIELSQAWGPEPWPPAPDPEPLFIHDNAIGFNDLRGTELQIALTPEGLDDVNNISRNLGDNRGHGLHPSLFGPGG